MQAIARREGLSSGRLKVDLFGNLDFAMLCHDLRLCETYPPRSTQIRPVPDGATSTAKPELIPARHSPKATLIPVAWDSTVYTV